MRNVNKENITDIFLDYFGDDTDPRLREIMVSLATHLHNFARETKLTHDEWTTGLDIPVSYTHLTLPTIYSV